MDLRVAAKWFDQTECVDAYGIDTFRAQLEPLEYYKIDGAAVKRRIISTAPEVQVPYRRTIRIDDQVYLIGDGTPEHFRGRLIRYRYVMSGADDLVRVLSLEDALRGTVVPGLWAVVVFNRLQPDERVSSTPLPEFQVFFGPREGVKDKDLVIAGSEIYWVQSVHASQSGLLSAATVRLEHGGPELATYSTTTYDPVQDVQVRSVGLVTALRLRWTEDFNYVDQGTLKYAHGDAVFAVLLSDVGVPSTDDHITLAGEEWRVVGHRVEGAVVKLHARRV